MREVNRRDFLTAALAGLSLGSGLMAAQEQTPGGIPTRPLGKTGRRISIIGVGGSHLAKPNMTEQLAVAIVQKAVDEGVTFMDNAACYNDGRSEQWMGNALAAGGRRDKVFLMTKVCSRDYKAAKEQLETSLRRLKTDGIDLWQFHNISYDDDAELIFDEKHGAIRAAREAKDAGKIRHIGYTSHFAPARHRSMLAMPFDWDAVQLVLNIADPFHGEFSLVRDALPQLARSNAGIIAMKGLAHGELPKQGIPAEVCRRYVLSLPVSTQVCGMMSMDELDRHLAIARGFQPMTKEELDRWAAQAESAAKHNAELEFYKHTWHHGTSNRRQNAAQAPSSSQKELP